MSRKSLVVGLAALVLLAGGVSVEKHRREGLPVLKGRCFTPGDGTGIAITGVKDTLDQDGKAISLYEGVLVVGPFQVPQLFKIREMNKAIDKALTDGKVQEVDCETGAPVSK